MKLSALDKAERAVRRYHEAHAALVTEVALTGQVDLRGRAFRHCGQRNWIAAMRLVLSGLVPFPKEVRPMR